MTMVRGLQERAARALPAEYVEDAGGWWLRHAPSCSWWIGTVLPHGESAPGELEERVATAEKFYAGRDTIARFQITPGACPGGLDAFLADRGYQRQSLISLQTAAAERVLEQTPTGSLQVRLHDRPTRAWFDVWHAVNGGHPRSEWDMLARVDRPGVYACAMAGDDVLAVGRVAADDGWAGVFGMATLPEARGKGAARDVLTALAGWADGQGMARMYLQVEHENVPARRLYARMGFTQISAYHYRTAE
ncbi:acetyltransferase [Acrocarpospora phusangensis]|uniref:Acetyltransferase n=1 Tax=Acrocarpospora phusangensis TaxID=1070424 RepID=A0A919QCR4_9ACTN|nr:GNAT family N-acetyltransferase [Acrocarpospora phusangensis]GIH26819.1 acetyltransferase [Acrocarpospora phusangensis]